MLVFLREIKVVIFYGCNGAMPTFSVYNGRMAKEVSKLTASLNLELINLKSSKILVKNWCHPNSNKTKINVVELQRIIFNFWLVHGI
jgi:hypothetical protein